MMDRFDVTKDEPRMKAIVTTGNGGYDRLEFRDVPMPHCGPGEALLQVLGAGVNNTEINTRLGWYSPLCPPWESPWWSSSSWSPCCRRGRL